MNLKTWIPLVLAAVLGVGAMIAARSYLSNNNNGPVMGNTTSVVTVNKDLAPGAQLSAADLSTVKVAGEVSHDAVFSNPADLDGRVVTASMLKGTPVIQTMLAPKGTAGGLQAVIPDGMRAITIEINEFSGVAGNLTPGCRVDVVATINGDDGGMLTRTIVQNVTVQALGTRQQAAAANGDQPAPVRSVTLLATPKEAEAIELAASTSRPRLVLRAANDQNVAQSDGVSAAELRRSTPKHDPFQFQQVEMLKAPTTQQSASKGMNQNTIKIIRGGVESEVPVPEVAMPVDSKWMSNTNTDPLPGNTNK